MATSESHCSDNFTLPVGATGARGNDGQQGPAGGPGVAPTQGPQGPAGEYKIDLTFQGSSTAYVVVNSTSPTILSYFIFPGTTTFGTPTYCAIAYRVGSASAVTTTFNIEVHTGANQYSTVGTVDVTNTATEADGSTWYIANIFNFSSLPASQEVFRLTANTVNGDGAAQQLHVASLELR